MLGWSSSPHLGNLPYSLPLHVDQAPVLASVVALSPFTALSVCLSPMELLSDRDCALILCLVQHFSILLYVNMLKDYSTW